MIVISANDIPRIWNISDIRHSDFSVYLVNDRSDCTVKKSRLKNGKIVQVNDQQGPRCQSLWQEQRKILLAWRARQRCDEHGYLCPSLSIARKSFQGPLLCKKIARRLVEGFFRSPLEQNSMVSSGSTATLFSTIVERILRLGMLLISIDMSIVSRCFSCRRILFRSFLVSLVEWIVFVNHWIIARSRWNRLKVFILFWATGSMVSRRISSSPILSWMDWIWLLPLNSSSV